ncbi:DUF2622 domain-containing protein [Chitinophaga sp. Ak27]|uniref:DUF2622 domain-containing protein n=1 Tax=Chitinophaga sp. Ak27 TaxID=2726116 RepID=UPI00145E28DF|nr:DUF2622 domain-containing protein [Chitinophaga sp. Ak27]NLU94894.1 DUF2622 domain-containing protein [Chitinophaga sp. Ak27]
MAKFTARVELHDGNEDDYETLHDEMEKEGFTRSIFSENKEYYLPPAEYNFDSGNATLDSVLSAAKAAAFKTGRKYAVLVTESAGRKWFGLTVAN